MKEIKIARLRPEAILPTRKHPQDAGIDLYSAEDCTIASNDLKIIPTGVTIEIPDGFVGLLKPKGKNDHLLGSGVVDAGYQGEILVKVINPFDHPVQIKAGEAICQMLILPIETPPIIEANLAEIHQKTSTRGRTGGIVSQYHP